MKTKEQHKSEFYQTLTKFYGHCFVWISSASIAWHLLNWTLTVPVFLFCFAVFITGKYLIKTAYQN